MPTTRVNRAVTLNEAVDRLREQLGSQYTVTPHANGSRETIRVQRAGVAFCTVHLAEMANPRRFECMAEACCSVGSPMNSSSPERSAGRSRIPSDHLDPTERQSRCDLERYRRAVTA